MSATLALIASSGALAAAEPSEMCADGKTEVHGAASDEFSLICSAAKKTREFFRGCGLSPHADLQIQVSREPLKIGSFDVFGCFDAESENIRVLGLAACEKAAASNDSYNVLPAKQFYRSIIAHEVAHRLIRRNLGARALPWAGHEYVAYAVQITLMPESHRRRFLAPIKRSAPSDLKRFSSALLMMAPATFAAMSYDHFTTSGNGCSLLRDLVEGSRTFPTHEEDDWFE